MSLKIFKSQNIFFPVGQGGFMYSRIFDDDNKKVDFVYDCGSISIKNKDFDVFLDKYTKEIFKHFTPKGNTSKPKIDYLYISHFDKDHINGIKKLCEIVDFKKIIYPLHDEAYRLLNVIYQISQAEGEDLDEGIFNVIYNPQENLQNFIGGEGDFRTEFIDLSPTDEPPPERVFSVEETSKNEVSGKGYHIKKIDTKWILYSFHPILPKDINYKELADELKVGFPDIEKWLENGTLVKSAKQQKDKIKKYFEDCLRKHKIKPSKNPFNRLSLLLYSGFLKQHHEIISTKIIFPRNRHPICFCEKYHFMCECFFWHCRYNHFGIPSGQYALLLTGDAELKGTAWHKYLNIGELDLCKNVTTVNLPHHGSTANIDDQTFSGFDNIQNFLTFAGDQTRYRHPHKKAMQCAIEAQPQADIFHVNQFQGLFEIIVLDE